MRIESIRLHPFGSTRDRTFTFSGGTNIVEGPNEAGKTTLCAALFHALFTPTDLTPSRAKKAIGRWLPKPSGDHARVTLVFIAHGIRHTLIRTWGAKANSELVLAGQAPLGDSKGVQERIQKALKWNEATWEHVLFINQAKLNGTLETISQADSIEELLHRSGAIDGDIAPEKLIAALEQRIAERYSRWDRQYNRPEGGRGIGNPWKKEVGPVLEKWYFKEALSDQYDQVVQHERDLDQVNGMIAEARDAMEKDKAFVEDGRKRKDGLHRRSFLEQGLSHRQKEVTRLMKVLVDWPGAEQIFKDKQEALERSNLELEKLKIEISNARLHEGSETVRKGYEALVQAKKGLDEVNKELALLKPVRKEDIDDVRKLITQIERISVEIKAQKLAATLQAAEGMNLQVQRGGAATETITLAANVPQELNAEGRITIVSGALTIGVRSDQKDVVQLYSDLENVQAQYQTSLQKLEVADLAALEARKQLYDETRQRAENAAATYKACLRSKTEEEWQAAMDKLKTVPATRALPELEKEQDRLVKEQARFQQETATLKKNIEEWSKAYRTVDELMGHVMELRTRSKAEAQELATLPDLPESFTDTDNYLKELTRAETAYERAKERLTLLLLRQSKLQGQSFESSAEELKERFELAEKEFQRQLNEAKAYERILAQVRALGEREGPDPFTAFNQRTTHFLHLLTDGRYKPQLDGVTAIGVHGDHLLENELLSQGTQGCLALAIRMAYAEVYLGENEGFMVMDDPLTDMDPKRRQCAVAAINDFARKYQVIVLTCHPEHAALFQEKGAAHHELAAGLMKEAV